MLTLSARAAEWRATAAAEKKSWKIPYVSLSFTYIYMNMSVFSVYAFSVCFSFERIVCATQAHITLCGAHQREKKNDKILL